ncbi:hypothetical protein TSA66_21630 [Noviherbaspirillum autotrophicum]|uniref:Uncharacterized protein n=1 Tax=Noviherbaspirillum autotrophicum TaxID=709839 RepID=A0A0C2BRZ6_9BURK|nr:hypothetical protein TSA66_21630 [Noviherbaspirillum autotrophicum]
MKTMAACLLASGSRFLWESVSVLSTATCRGRRVRAGTIQFLELVFKDQRNRVGRERMVIYALQIAGAAPMTGTRCFLYPALQRQRILQDADPEIGVPVGQRLRGAMPAASMLLGFHRDFSFQGDVKRKGKHATSLTGRHMFPAWDSSRPAGMKELVAHATHVQKRRPAVLSNWGLTL